MALSPIACGAWRAGLAIALRVVCTMTGRPAGPANGALGAPKRPSHGGGFDSSGPALWGNENLCPSC